jgi:hypothetical protein
VRAGERYEPWFSGGRRSVPTAAKRNNVIACSSKGSSKVAKPHGQAMASNCLLCDDITIGAGFSYQLELKPHWSDCRPFCRSKARETRRFAPLGPWQAYAVAFERNMPMNR